MHLYGEQAVPYQVHAVFSLTVAVGEHDFCSQIQRSGTYITGKIVYLLDIVESIGDKGSGHDKHHNKVDNGVECLAGFSLYQSRVGNIDTHDKDNEKQEAHIKASASKGSLGSVDTVCHVVDKVQLICLLDDVPCGIGKIQADSPDKVGDTVKHVFTDFPIPSSQFHGSQPQLLST